MMYELTLRLSYIVTKSAPYHFTNGDLRLTDDRLRGGRWRIVGEIAAVAAEEEEMSHTRERERAREKEKLQPLHCSLQTFTGSAI